MSYSYACLSDGTLLSNLHSHSQTLSHYNRSGDEKSDCMTNESDRSSHPFCSCRHLHVFCRSTCHASFFLAFSDLHSLSLLVLSPFVPFAPSPFFYPSPTCPSVRIPRISRGRLNGWHGWFLPWLSLQRSRVFRF